MDRPYDDGPNCLGKLMTVMAGSGAPPNLGIGKPAARELPDGKMAPDKADTDGKAFAGAWTHDYPTPRDSLRNWD